MMAAAVETQRLISVSLGKIAQSRAQRGGINLHKNLLVASVLNKARTAFMMENYSHQLSLQQQRQQQQQQIVLTATHPSPSPVSAEPQRDGNSLSSHVVKTCQSTPESESRSAPVDTQVPPVDVIDASDMEVTAPVVCNKENISPTENSFVAPSVEVDINDSKQECVSGEQHIEAANQLSHDAQLAGSEASQNTLLYSSCKQSSNNTTCNVLKRKRVNPEAIVSHESDSPIVKKSRVSSSDCSHTHSCEISSSCDHESSDIDSPMQTDSPQISNLVTIFNSGFSGLCVSSSSSSSPFDSSYQSDNSSSLSHSHQWSMSDNQSLHCSSQVERIGSLSSAIVLSA